MKLCKECNKDLLLDNYKGQEILYCSKRCKDKKSSRVIYDRRKEWFRQQKDKPCVDCGRKFPWYCMDFDHKPGFEKKFNLCYNHLRSLEVVKDEISKCDLVCAVCHRIRTHARKQYRS